MMDLFLTNKQLFALKENKLWTGVVWIIGMFLSAVWTLILTAPIHCRGSTGEQVKFSKSDVMKKQTHLHFRWPEGEYIFFLVNYSFRGTVSSTEHSDFQAGAGTSRYGELTGSTHTNLH